MLIGNNGAGKSTLLRIVSSLMRPTKGKIHFRGTNQREKLREWLQIMGSITHENRLYGDLSSIDNLRLYGTLYGVEELKSKIDEILCYNDEIFSTFSATLLEALKIMIL